MSPLIRRILALVGAIVAAAVIVMVLGHLADTVSPPPPGTGLEKAIEEGEVPFTNLALVLGGWLLAAWVGGTIASRVSRERSPLLVFTALVTAMTVINLKTGFHPTWMWVAGLVGVPLLALGAAGESITLRGR